MLDFALKNTGLRSAALLVLFLLALPGGLFALPVAVEQVAESYSLKHAAFYLIDERGEIGILEASSPLRQNQYSRLEDGIPVMSEGKLWLRFSLIKNNQALMRPLPEGSRAPLFLDLGQGISGARLYVAESVSTNGEIKTWRESAPLGSGHFALPEPDLLPLTVYVNLPGIPSLWFDPLLIRGDVDNGPITWTLIMQIAMGLALAVVLVRGMTENDEWRFWAGAVLACAIVPALFGQHGSEPHIVYLTAMPRLLAPGLAIMLMPHLGRYLLNSRETKGLDYTLIALSSLGVMTALAPLVPGLGWTARLLPLAPLLLLPLILIALARVKSGQSGAELYLLFNLFPFIGAFLALLPLLSPRFQALAHLGPSLTALGYLIGGWVLAVGKPSAPKEKGDFFPLNDFLEDGPLSVVSSVKASSERKKCSTSAPLDELMDGPPLSAHTIAGTDCADPVATPAPKAEAAAEKKNLAELADIFGPLDEKPVETNQPEVIDLGLDMEVFTEDDGDAEENQTSPVPDEENAADLEPVEDQADEYSAEAAPLMKQDENIIYIKDEEEPGLVILKPTGPTPVEGLAPVNHNPAHNWEYTAIPRLESALRAPYLQLVSQLDELRSRQELAADYTEGLGKSLDGLGLMLDNLERLARGEALSGAPSHTIFNLARLIRRIHEELLPLAEERGVTLSWFVAPGLPAYFKGMEQEIAQAVKFLLQGTLDGAAAGSPGGAVQLSVRQGGGHYSGQIQFSLQESGMRPGHMKRPSGWLNKAWELAASSGGSFNIDFIPNKGMALTLALPLTPVPERSAAEAASMANMRGSAALAEFAPGPEPEGAEEPIPGLPSIEEEDDGEVLLLTDAIIPAVKTPDPEAEPEPEQEPEPAPRAKAEPTQEHEAAPAIPEPLIEPEPPLEAEWTEADESSAESVQTGETPQAEPDLIIISDDEIMDIPASLLPEVSAPRPSTQAPRKPSREPDPQKGPREYIVIADMAASGRRLLARRLDGLPHKLLEARNADEIIRTVSRNPVGLIILDADMPEADVKKALEKVAAYNLSHSLPDTPTLCILSHESQAERMSRLGCSETQIKSASRVQFRQAVLRLCPHPKADPAEMLPESPLLRAATQQNAPQPEPAPESPHTPAPASSSAQYSKTASKERVPMLDMIVASLDENEQGKSAPGANGAGKSCAVDAGGSSELKAPYPLLLLNGEKMEAEMVPLIPGLLIVLEDSLEDLSAARQKQDAEHIRDIAARMSAQGGAFGLQTLERMARCVKRAAEAGDAEAIRDFSDELLALGRRYLSGLKETHDDYLKKR